MNGAGTIRFVALGDSTTEGVGDPRPDGALRGWADRLAERLGPGTLYANLAIRGRLARQVRDEQLEAALAMEPTLASVICGLNDLLRRGCDVDAVAGHVEAMHVAVLERGTTVIGATFPDLSAFVPAARLARARLAAFNAALRASAQRTGIVLLDLGALPVAADPRLWTADRLHPNPDGHARIAATAAHALGLSDDEAWREALPPAVRRRRAEVVASELAWTGRHMAPWVWRRVRGRSSGDGITAKRPRLAPVDVVA